MEHSENASRDIKYAIEFFAGKLGLKDTKFMTANVDEVQEADRTISCSIVLGETNMKLTGVNLQSEPNDGFILIPALNTDVLICMMADNSAYVLLCNDIDKIICVIDNQNSYIFDSNGFVWNGGNNGGLVKVIELTQKVNNLEALVNNLLTTLKTTTIPLAPSGTYPFAPLYAAYNTLTPTQRSDIEDTLIKH